MTDAEKLARALRELLEYTGGSDLVKKQPSHPIAKAFVALERFEARRIVEDI